MFITHYYIRHLVYNLNAYIKAVQSAKTHIYLILFDYEFSSVVRTIVRTIKWHP